MQKWPPLIRKLALITILCTLPFASAFAEKPFVLPDQDIVIAIEYEDLQFWERDIDDPLLLAPPPLEQGVPILTVIAVHIGAKDCMVLECGGEAILLDCGLTGNHNIVERVIRQMGIDHFTAAINTHPHDDHLSAYPEILAMFPAAVMYVCFPEDTNGWSKFLHNEMAALDIPVEQLDINQPMQLGAATLHFRQYTKGDDVNKRSLVIQAVLGERTILLSADAYAAQNILVEQYGPDALQGDILKAPHHGLNTLTGDFIRAVRMQAIFITNWPWDSGEEFIKQLRRMRFEGIFTGLGSVVMKTDGKKWIITQLPRELP